MIENRNKIADKWITSITGQATKNGNNLNLLKNKFSVLKGIFGCKFNSHGLTHYDIE